MDAQEPALPGVTVALLDENGGVAAEQTVGEDGRYSFRLIRSGHYSLRFTLPGDELFADQSGEAGGSCVAPCGGQHGGDRADDAGGRAENRQPQPRRD